MSRPTHDQIRSIGNVTQIFRWNMIFAQFPAGLPAPPSSDALNLRCESADLPKLTGTNTETKLRGFTVRQAGRYDYNGQTTLTFVETVDNVVASFMKKWRDICWAPKTGIQLPKDQLEAVILLQRLNQQDEPIWEYKLVGAFMQDYTSGQNLDGQSQDALKPTLVLAWDYFEDRAL